MNILQIVPELKSGGVERGTVDLAKYLRKAGHKSVVVSAGGPLVNDLTSAGVIHYALPVHRKNPISLIRSVRALTKIVKLESIDVIHARSRVPALAAFIASRRTHVPFVTTCHGFYQRHWLSRVMGWGKIVIVTSHIIGRHMRENFGVPQRKLRLIPRGVNFEEFKISPDAEARRSGEVIIGLIGRLTPIKGHRLFLKAMARVARVYPGIKVQLVGEAAKPQYLEELLALTRHLGLSQCVEFLGTRYDVPQLLSKMSILVVPSVGEEAFGRVAIEAGACGVPVVATQMGGLVDIIENEKSGLLVPPDDPRVLAEATLRLLNEPELARRLARALHERVKREFNGVQMFEKTLEVYREAVSRKRILVIKLSALGDVILSIPSLRALRRKFPQGRISVLVDRRSRNIIRNCPYIDDTLVYQEGKNRLWPLWRIAKILADEDFDIVVDLQNNRVSHWLAFLSGARIRAGHANRRWSFLLNHKAPPLKATLPPLEHQFRVLKLLGVSEVDKQLELWTQPEEDEKIREFLEREWVSKSQVLVGINPGSSPRWPTKQWPVESFAKLCDELAKRNIRVVLTGSADDLPLSEELVNLTRNKPINAVGKTTITELASLVKRCQVFISSDSAPMHIASSMDVPLVALFGPTDPHRHLAPPTHYQVFWKEVHCSPCYLRSCPIGLICMKRISVQEVLDAVLHFIKDKPSPIEEQAVAGS